MPPFGVRTTARAPKKALGKLFIFAGAKGGSGVTTIAANFAIMLAQESQQNTLLLDLDLPLGVAALDLGINTQFSTANALQNASRLDSNFLSKLISSIAPGSLYSPLPIDTRQSMRPTNRSKSSWPSPVRTSITSS